MKRDDLFHKTENRQIKWKLCGLRRMEDIAAANDAKPDFAGFIFAADRRRYISPEEAETLRRALDPSILTVGVFVNASAEQILADTAACRVDLIQLHGQEDNAFIAALREALANRDAERKTGHGVSCQATAIIKALRISSAEDLRTAAESAADYVLLDNGIGGTGKAFDWGLLRHFPRPYILAGGISEENLENAAALHPWAVDVSSSLETDGVKDPAKIVRFARKMQTL